MDQGPEHIGTVWGGFYNAELLYSINVDAAEINLWPLVSQANAIELPPGTQNPNHAILD